MHSCLDQKYISQIGNCLPQLVVFSGLKFRGKIPSDGNCLFHAVSDQLQRVSARPMYNHSELRALAVKQLTDNPFVVTICIILYC
jgi:hypothetical protein